MLTNASVRTRRGVNQIEYIWGKNINIGEIWLVTEELILALHMVKSLSDLQKRLLGETNGHLITFHAIMKISSSLDHDANSSPPVAILALRDLII